MLVSACMPEMRWLCFHFPAVPAVPAVVLASLLFLSAVLIVRQKTLGTDVTLRARLSCCAQSQQAVSAHAGFHPDATTCLQRPKAAPLSLPVMKPPALRTPRLASCRVRSFSPGRLCAITQPALPRGLKRSTAWSFPKG